jgi:uridine kinase
MKIITTYQSKVSSSIQMISQSNLPKRIPPRNINPEHFKYIQGYEDLLNKRSNDLPPMNLSPVIVGIAGGSGSGKTTLTKAIGSVLGEEYVSFLSHDSYYKDLRQLSMEERNKVNFDHPDSLDTALLEQHVRDLKQGKSVQVPVYDFKTHSRTLESITVVPRQIVIVDGILLFAEPELVKQFDMKIFVDTEDDIRLIRRLQRDVAERQRTVESVIEQYCKTVRPMHQLYVEPSKRKADIIVPAGQGIQAVALDMCVSRMREIINFYQ